LIEVEHVSKVYPGAVAVDDISFQVSDREIVGFLGPNGAGKTTTLRILSSFIPPTSGRASVAGFDVFKDSLSVRKLIGYLPENVPLYPEMRAREYLTFRARLKSVARRDVCKRVDYAMERCGVTDVSRRIVGQLSKGYRQRVGLADCLLSNPKVLLLDEPTIGLDPTQIRQVRDLIHELGRDHTVVLSTHILPEVEMVCNRVIIINNGRIVASDTMENLKVGFKKGRAIVVEVKAKPGEVEKALTGLKSVRAVKLLGANGSCQFRVVPEAHVDPREDVFRCLAGSGWAVTEMRSESLTLEDVFVRVTASEVRSSGGEELAQESQNA